MDLYLASKSPRRKSILQDVEYDFTVIDAPFDESSVNLSVCPDKGVLDIARGKAEAGFLELDSSKRSTAVVLAADTIVVFDGKVMLKPRDSAEAKEMLQRLSGRRHEVYTAVAIVSENKKSSFVEKTDVFFKDLSDDEIDTYILSGEPLDKAGAYGIQGKACLFVNKIDGDYFNVVGLPICHVFEELKLFDIGPRG